MAINDGPIGTDQLLEGIRKLVRIELLFLLTFER